ncbi:MAG: DUF4838 domain-containing protein [Ruminococcaceae bacterium]|nr:DUF4838 domain-containing protein [Oscillospiraceae bacterium]
MMILTLARVGTHPTVAFAASELARYLKMMDRTLFVQERVYDKKEESTSDAIWLGLDGSMPYSADHDGFCIALNGGKGSITAANERSVLIAVYRLLQALGCRFLFPGKSGEVVPARTLDAAVLTLHLEDRPSYRHRAICIEGAVGYEHVYNTIDWLPKVGMNGYFVQFKTPSVFFKRFYNQTENPYMPYSPVTDADIAHILGRLEEEIAKRSLDYHAMGHGWTCEPFGLDGNGWSQSDESAVPPEALPFLAELNGKRGLRGGVALNTNLCYSNREARRRMIDAVVAYCKEHKQVNFLHFWLADGSNNHCECAACAVARPSDFYVMLLNELDARLAAENISTRIVCLVYVDLLWAPEREKIQNPDRFVLMFAPITRTYSNAFAEFDVGERLSLPPYVRNQLTLPKSVAENMALLQTWQKEQLSGDSFDFDYHLMWDHDVDPGYMECARILHADMAGLYKLGLDGMVSCQLQRAAFPTGLPQYAMARALWDKSSSFEEIVREYFTAAFGDEGEAVRRYLDTLSALFDPPRVRGEREQNDGLVKENCRKARALVQAFRRERGLCYDDVNPSRRYLAYHADLVLSYADWHEALFGGGDEAAREAAKAALTETAYRIEPHVHEVFDVCLYKNTHFVRYMRRYRDV